jgi:methylenetetrahydrofolate dehydrogenase (NADP+)/methenyltetrahydrofolate cyclohydrolase
MAIILDGKVVRDKILEELKAKVGSLGSGQQVPGLAVVLVGEDPASKVYVGSKVKACRALGYYSEEHRLPVDTTQDELMSLIRILNRNGRVHGILVQLPLPPHLKADPVIEAIDPAKDVDGLHPLNAGYLSIGRKALTPCTPTGVMEILKHYEIPIEGRKAVVIGRSILVGKPMAQLLLAANATVTVCHSKTPDIAEVAREADILVAAIGKAGFVNADMVKPGATVVDVGINRSPDGKLVGDVDYGPVERIAFAITPVPGGVGPMTIAMLMKNTYQASQV